MSLIQSAKFNGHVAYAYFKDPLTRLPTQRSEIGELCRIVGNRLSYARRDARTLTACFSHSTVERALKLGVTGTAIWNNQRLVVSFDKGSRSIRIAHLAKPERPNGI